MVTNPAPTVASFPQDLLMPINSAGLCPGFEKQIFLTFTQAKQLS